MMKVSAGIEGIERLKPMASQAVGRMRQVLLRVLADGAEAIAANARARVLELRDADRRGPSDLADSIRVEADDEGARVVAEAPHAPYVEFGTRRMAAEPFLSPVMEEERESIIERAGRALGAGDGA